jgi:hypothetical protein
MRLLLISLLLICFTGCSIFRTETQSEEKQQSHTIIDNNIEIEGVAAGVPFRARIVHTGKSDTTGTKETQETKDISSPAAESGMGWVGNLLLILLGGGGVGAIINKVKNGTIARITQGVDAFMEENAKAGEQLKNHLSKKMDRSDKDLVKKVKKK